MFQSFSCQRGQNHNSRANLRPHLSSSPPESTEYRHQDFISVRDLVRELSITVKMLLFLQSMLFHAGQVKRYQIHLNESAQTSIAQTKSWRLAGEFSDTQALVISMILLRPPYRSWGDGGGTVSSKTPSRPGWYRGKRNHLKTPGIFTSPTLPSMDLVCLFHCHVEFRVGHMINFDP